MLKLFIQLVTINIAKYDPDSEENWMGQTSPTCKTRATSYYNKAVAAYKNGDIESAMEYLGRGTHYVSDANEPHHAVIIILFLLRKNI